jgi:hypothetical protein
MLDDYAVLREDPELVVGTTKRVFAAISPKW